MIPEGQHRTTTALFDSLGYRVESAHAAAVALATACDSCHRRPAGHGHFGLYCEPCSDLPYGVEAP